MGLWTAARGPMASELLVWWAFFVAFRRRPAISGRGLVGLWPYGRVLSTLLLLSGYSQHSSPLPLVAAVAVRIYVDNDLVAAERTILNPEP